MSAIVTVYAVAAHRSWDNYYSRFFGCVTSLAEIQSVFRGVAALTHGETATFRRDTRHDDHRTPDEFVVLRYDLPADADHLYIQTIRWKYAGLTMTAGHEGPVEVPRDLDPLSDCVNDYVWTRPPSPPLPAEAPESPTVVTAT